MKEKRNYFDRSLCVFAVDLISFDFQISRNPQKNLKGMGQTTVGKKLFTWRRRENLGDGFTLSRLVFSIELHFTLTVGVCLSESLHCTHVRVDQRYFDSRARYAILCFRKKRKKEKRNCSCCIKSSLQFRRIYSSASTTMYKMDYRPFPLRDGAAVPLKIRVNKAPRCLPAINAWQSVGETKSFIRFRDNV